MSKEKIIALVRNRSFQIGVTSVLSAAAGGAGGYFFAKDKLKTYYEEIANREIAEAKEFYGRLHKTDDSHSSPEAVLEQLHGKEAIEALRSYQGIAVEAPAATEEELIVEEAVEQDDEEATPVTVVNNIFVDREDRGFDYEVETPLRTEERPYIITQEEYLQNEKDYEQTKLSYFEGDDVLVDEEDDPLPDPDDTVGEDHLVRFGHGSKDNNTVYVRNDALEMEFEIVRSYGKYAQEVLGFIEHSDRQGLRKFRGHDD